MKLTVPTAIAERAVPAELLMFSAWANSEVVPVLTQLRNAANYMTLERVDFTSTGTGTLDQIWESDVMPTDGTWTITVHLAAAGADYASTGVVFTTRSVAGAVSLVSSTTLWSHMGAATAAAVVVDATARTAQLQFNDGGAADLKVVAVIETLEAVIE